MPGQMEVPTSGKLEDLLRWAETKVCLSLAVSIYYKPPAESFVEGFLECYREYLDLCEPYLTWFASETGAGYRKADPKVLRIPFRRLPDAVDKGKFWSWCAMAGEHHRHAAPYQFEASVSDDPDNLSSFRAAFPVSMFSNDFGRFVELVKSLAARAPFFFGYGGFSLSNSLVITTQQSNEIYLAPVAMRFHGVQVEEDTKTRLCCQDSIKGVDWLTLLAPSLVERVGGISALRAQLGEAITAHELPNGLVIQAGPAPKLGDVNAGERLPLYRKVHRVLTPIRNLNHWPLGDRAFLQDETRRWMARFDD